MSKNMIAQMLTLAASTLHEKNSKTMIAVAARLDENHGRIAIATGGAIMLLDQADISIGTSEIRLGSLRIAYDGLTIASDKYTTRGETRCLRLDHESSGDRRIMTICSHNEGLRLMKAAAAEAVDHFGMEAHRKGEFLIYSKDMGLTCETLDPKKMLINQHGLALDDERIVAWEQMKAIDTNDSVSIALKDKRMVTVSSG